MPPGVDVHSLPWRPSPLERYQQFRAATVALAQATRSEVIHDRGLWLPENAAAAAAAHALGLPLIAQPCGMLQAWPMAQKALKKRLAWALYQRRLLQRAAAVITTCAEERDETAARLGDRARVVCIPHGVTLPTLAADAPRRRQAVYLGRLHPKKQVDLLLRAWAAIAPQGWQLHIAGSGEPAYEAMLRDEATALGITEAVRFHGSLVGEAKHELLATSQLFLQPSLQENFGLAVAEALAHGLPALTTTAMPWAHLVSAGAGWSVTPDVTAVTAALRQALALDETSLLAMGQRARMLATGLSWQDNALRVRALYQSALPQSSTARLQTHGVADEASP